MKRRKDFFQIINNFPHTFAVYLTFTLDKEVIQKIAESSYGNIIILHDYRQGVSLKNNWNNRVVCIPINVANHRQQNCFHSKLALLKGEDKAKLLIGSANLSKDSFSSEKDLCCEIDLDFYSEVYQSVVKYIQELIPQTRTSTEVLPTATNKLRYSAEETKKSSNLKFICNTKDSSIWNNICEHLPQEDYPILKIASPFLSAEFSEELLNFINRVNPKEIRFFLRSNYPLPKSLKSVNAEIKLFQPKFRSSRKYFHAKIISIEYSNAVITFLGSANFSKQGFFQTLDEGANQECGIVITSKDKTILNDWFGEGWEKPVTPDNWKEDEKMSELPEEKFEGNPYVWAESTKDGIVKIFFYIPQEEFLNDVFVDERKVQLTAINNELNIFLFEYKFKKNVVKVKIGNSFEEEIIVFNEDSFEEKAKEIGESLFFEPNKIDSVNPKVLRDAIEQEGIKISIMGNVVIEPPQLEQYFYNVKNQINILSRKKFFSDFHYQELKSLLEKIEGGEGIYLSSQLYKCFENKKQNRLSKLCSDRIQEILNENSTFEIGFESYKNFLNKWKKL